MRDSIFFAIQYALKIILVFSLSVSISLTSVLWSLPKGGKAVHKQAKFSQSAKELIIRPEDNSILHFDSFNIQKDETVRFLQQSSQSRVLNKVMGNEATHIYGQLFSNGKVYLVNPAGIFFGQEAIVKVGALYAAAGNITNHDFISSRDYFSSLSNDLINEGFIQAQLVHLLGKNVVNKGSIVAPKGVVSLISADSVLIGQLDGHLFFEFKKSPDNSSTGEVIQDGLIQAEQGEVFLGAADIYAISLKQHSQTKAKKLTMISDKGDIQIKGEIEANKLKVYTKGSLSHSGQSKVFNQADFIVNQIDVSGLLDASNAVVSLQGANYSRIVLGSTEDRALSISASSLENIHAMQLELGGAQTENLVIHPMDIGATKKIGKLKLAALESGGKIHFKKGEHKLPHLEAIAEQELLVEGRVKADSIIFSQLDKDSQNALVKIEADITSPGNISLYSPHLIELKNGASLKAGKDIYIENLSLSQSESLQDSFIQSKENVILSGKQELSGEISFQADYDNNKTGDFILALESQIHHQEGSLSISGADIQVNGKVWVDESLNLNSSANQDINLALKETEGFSLSQSELNRIYVKELSIGSKETHKIQLQDINTKIADKLSLKAAHIKVSGSQVLSRDVDVLALSSVDINADKWDVDGALLIKDLSDDVKVKISSYVKAKQIKAVASDIKLNSGVLDVSANDRAGNIYLGAESKDEKWASKVSVDNKSILKANTLIKGDGGEILALAEEQMDFRGSIEAKGGVNGGDGGFAEVSSKKQLGYFGKANLKAPEGQSGKLLLDPENVIISENGINDNLLPSISENDSGNLYLSSAALLESLKNSNVEVLADENIYVNASLVDMSEGLKDLVLTANNSIYLNEVLELNASINLQAKEAAYINKALHTEKELSINVDGGSVQAGTNSSITASAIHIQANQVGMSSSPIAMNVESLKTLEASKAYIQNSSSDQNEDQKKESNIIKPIAQIAQQAQLEDHSFKSKAKKYEEKIAKKIEERRKAKLKELYASGEKVKGVSSEKVAVAMKKGKKLSPLGAGDRFALSFRYGKNNEVPKGKKAVNIEAYLKNLSR